MYNIIPINNTIIITPLIITHEISLSLVCINNIKNTIIEILPTSTAYKLYQYILLKLLKLSQLNYKIYLLKIIINSIINYFLYLLIKI